MKTLRMKTHLILLLAVSLPILQNCGKARYDQVTPAPQTAMEQPIPPSREPLGPMDVTPRPQPPAPAPSTNPPPPPNSSGEEGPRPELVEPEPQTPAPVPVVEGPDVPWMDPTHYGPAGGTRRPPPPPPPPPVVDPRPPKSNEVCVGLECFKGTYTQPRTLVTDKLDILFVVDTSDSIFKEREQAALGIDRFVSALPSGIDYHIGVMVAHSPYTGRAGELVSSEGQEPAVLWSSRMSMDQIRAALHAKLTRIKGDRESDGGELGLYSLNAGLTGDRLQQNLNLGMFRHDAGLAVIFMSDENDICSLGNYPAGVTPKPDPNNKEVPAYEKYCRGRVTPDSVYTKLMQLKAGFYNYESRGEVVTKPLLLSGIVYTNPATVPSVAPGDKYGQENEVGYGLTDIVNLNNGTLVDLAAGDIPGALRKIGEAARSKLSFKKDFLIHSNRVVDPNTICALVDGVEVGHLFNHNTKTIHLAKGGGPGSFVELFWCEEAVSKGQVLTSTSIVTKQPDRYQRMPIDPRCTILRQKYGGRPMNPGGPTGPVVTPPEPPPVVTPPVVTPPPVVKTEINSSDYLCSELQAMVQTKGRVFIKGYAGSRWYVSERRFCDPQDTGTIAAYDKSRDVTWCRIGDSCERHNDH